MRPAATEEQFLRFAAPMFVIGGIVSFAANLFPHSLVAPGDLRWVLPAIAVASGIGFRLLDGHVGPWFAHVVAGWASLITCFALGVTHTAHAAAVLMLGAMLFAGWFHGARAIAAHGAWLSLCYGVTLLLSRPPVPLLPQWTLTMAVLIAVAGLLRFARKRERALAIELAALAGSDPLTGLGNRRRLLEVLGEVTASRTPATLVLFDLNGFKLYNDRFGHLAGDALLARLGEGLAAVTPRAFRLGGDEFCVLLDGDAGDAGIELCRAALSERGEGFDITAAGGWVRLPAEATSTSDALHLADMRMYGEKLGGADRAPDPRLLRQLLGECEANEHVAVVRGFAVAIGARLGLDEAELEVLGNAAELHDAGKIAMPDTVLDKPGALDEREWGLIRLHPLVSECLVKRVGLAECAPIVRAHHERFAGGGYPDGLRGDAIPLGARIVAVCDAYSAMTEARPYHGAIPVAEAVAELQRCAGGQFDPQVVAAMLAEIAARADGVAPPASAPSVAHS